MNENDLPKQDHMTSDTRRLTDDTVDGSVVSLVYASDDGRYVVLRAVDKREGSVFSMVGDLQGLTEGQDFQATGKWETHRDHGRQFKVENVKPVLPSTKEGVVRYLASGILPGVGNKLAARIVDKFGVKSLEILDNYSSRLTEVEGLGKGRVAKIKDAWKAHGDQREMNLFMQSLGISSAYCRRIVRHFGDRAPLVIQNNPYQLTQVRGIGFRMADAVASRMGIEKSNAFRLAAGVRYAVDELTSREGHVCLPEAFLIESAAKVLEVDEAGVRIGLQRAYAEGALIVDNGVIYPRDLHDAEVTLADIVSKWPMDRRQSLPKSMPVSSGWHTLNAEQQQGVRQAFRYGLSIITGGPGVGKTTVTREIVHVAQKMSMTVMLAAPTGRAAKRLSESTGEPAKTIHRLLKWEPAKLKFVHDENNKLTVDLLVIDEISMIDISLAASLFRALPESARVVLVGDGDQLPSVGPGNVLADLLSSRRVPSAHLNQIYRQAAGSRIIASAHRVNSGQMPDLQPIKEGTDTDFYWIEQDDPAKVLETIATMVSDRIPKHFGFSPEVDVQVLVPMNRGTCGAQALNRRLQSALRPPKMGEPFLEYGGACFRHGDRVMQVVNNYDLGVFNGDMGTLVEISQSERTFRVAFDSAQVVYQFDDLEQVRHAFAITIHKSQGSEFPVVIVPLLTGHFMMLRRNLLYTAMTRAGKLLILIGSRDAVSMAVRNVRNRPRHTRLVQRLEARH
jgi:exodeoxyribonuclease V alpha subunit